MIRVESVGCPIRRFIGQAERRLVCWLFGAACCCAIFFPASMVVEAQSTPRRDAQALSFLTQAIAGAGGSSVISAITDFTATGSITYSWDNSSVQGDATIKSRGLTQFRLDSQVPDGTWSMIVSNGAGVLKLPDGTSNAIAYHNVLNAGSLTLPIIPIAAALQDTTITVIDDGVVPLGNGQAHQITIQQNLPSATGSTNQFSIDTKRDYFFDPSSFVLLQVQDTVHPDGDAMNGGVQHIIGFSNYQIYGGVLAPLSIADSVGGQSIWSIQMTGITFNTGLSDSDFQF